MSNENLESAFKDLKLPPKSDINILLLGGTGVGKSTLINAFANYLTYSEMKKAKKDNLLVLIPTEFGIQDKYNENHIVNTGQSDKNEFLQVGDSATQDVKTYVFPIWDGKIKIRLIDTPGMGDTRGPKQDDINSENILSYIGNLHELHAICFLLKPNESRDTVFFKYCMNQILSRLDKSATDNIIFCFTNTRGSDYNPGETERILKKMIDDIGSKPPFAKIPLNKNIFCFDNESFKYLAAVKAGIEFDPEIKERNKESWDKSASQCWKLIHYITGDKDNRPLKPHHVKSTNAINEARRIINQLAQPLTEITQLIHHNMSALERHRENLRLDRGSVEEMQKNLYIPVITLETIQMPQPATVCTTMKCCEVYKVAGKNIIEYKQRCHDPCYLNNVPKEIIGSPELMNCAAMSGSTTCTKCSCDFRVHMHIYYRTKTKEIQEKDENMAKKITNRQELMKHNQQLMHLMETKKNELDEEQQVILRTCAKFAHFLQNNAITPFNDAYKDYIEYLVNRERSMGPLCDADTVVHLQHLMLQYVELKSQFDEALRLNQALGRGDAITPKEVSDSVQELYKLKHNGKKIKELYECQKKSRNTEYQNTEYLHTMPIKKVKKAKKDKERKDKKDKDNNEKKDKDKKEKKDKDKSEDKDKKGDKNQSKGKRDTQNARSNTPPPSYHEAHRAHNSQNRGPQYPPGYNQPHNYPYGGPQHYQGQPTYPYPPVGPQYSQGNVPYSPNAYGQPGHPPSYDNKIPDLRDLDINITVKKPSESTSKQQQPQQQQHPYTPNAAYPNYPPHPNFPQYPPNFYPPPGGAHGPQPNPQGYPNPQNPYDYHHGVNRQNSGGGGGNQRGNSNYRGNNQSRGAAKANTRGRGGIQKTRNKNEKKEDKKNKSSKKKSNDSDSSDSSSSSSSSS